MSKLSFLDTKKHNRLVQQTEKCWREENKFNWKFSPITFITRFQLSSSYALKNLVNYMKISSSLNIITTRCWWSCTVHVYIRRDEEIKIKKLILPGFRLPACTGIEVFWLFRRSLVQLFMCVGHDVRPHKMLLICFVVQKQWKTWNHNARICCWERRQFSVECRRCWTDRYKQV
jgi:hypothetical protein